MKEIVLANLSTSQVSDEDFLYLSIWNWSLNVGYVNRLCTIEGHVFMHNVIAKRMGLVLSAELEIDHKDRDPLNNQRDNLRLVTLGVNRSNRGLFRNSTSGVTGVSFFKQRNCWRAYISVKGKQIRLGNFHSFELACKARRQAEIKHGVGKWQKESL